MCGLNGIFAYGHMSPPVSCDELIITRDYMAARGPDGAGVWLSEDSRTGLAHRRLAILDITDAGAQPMAASDGRQHIVFNGEIYNFRELATQLKARGHVLHSRSDTEVLLAGWREWGEALVDRLQGMFAFVIWDADRQGLFMARDAFGIKPLYVADNGHTLRFASQVRALLAGGGVSHLPDPAGEAGFWLWGSVPEPHTLYRAISAFPAGHARWYGRDGLVRTRCFADLPTRLLEAEQASAHWSQAEVEERFHAAFSQSLDRHLLSDAPVGVFLSGGIDSGAIALQASRRSSANLRSLTLDFDVFAGGPADETKQAARLAAQAGMTHSNCPVSREDFLVARQALLQDMDQPSLDGVNTWLISREARAQGLKVALSGLGGDELLAGYPSFRQVPALAQVLGSLHAGRRVLWRGVRLLTAPWLHHVMSGKYAGLLEYGTSISGAYLLRRAAHMPWELPRHLPAEVRGEGLDTVLATYARQSSLPAGLSARGQVSALEMLCYQRNQLLRDADWAGMAHGVEIRVPLLDLDLLAVASRADKIMLARIAGHPAAQPGGSTKKLGFVAPVAEWLKAGESTEEPVGRGLSTWMHSVSKHHVIRATLPQPIALWVPEMAQPGGVQSYMWRLWEVMHFSTANAQLLSLNDRAADLWSRAGQQRVRGAGACRLAFTLQALWSSRHLVTVGHVNQTPVAWLLRRLGLIKRYLVVLHGIEAWRPLSRWQRMALREAAAVVTTTRHTRDVCCRINNLPVSNFHVLPLCVPQHVPEIANDFKLSGSFPVLFVARLAKSESYKGLEAVIQAIAAMQAQGLALTLHVVGDGDDRQRLEALARHHLQQNTAVFHGWLDDANLQAAYASAAVFAMPSAKEGFGIVFLEAMRHGVPCIGGDHGGTPDVISHGEEGYLIQYGDVEALATHLTRLLNDPDERQRLGQQAQARYVRDFTFEQFRQRWLELWQRLSAA